MFESIFERPKNLVNVESCVQLEDMNSESRFERWRTRTALEMGLKLPMLNIDELAALIRPEILVENGNIIHKYE